MPKPHICVILNPASGKKKDNPATNALIDLIRSNPDLDLRLLDDPSTLDDVVAQAVRDGFDIIVAAGGDGTIGGVTAGLMDTGVTLGVVPLGTFNFVARGLGIPEDPAEALEVVLRGDTAPLPVGQVNGRIFLNNASLGAYAAVLDVREGVYRRWGRSRLAAYWSVIVAMLTLYRPLHMTVTVDGQTRHLRSPMAFVASSAYQLDQYNFDGADDVRAGKLALILAPDTNRVRLLWRAVKILFGGIRRGTDYQLLIGKDISIATRRGSRLVARDGENARMKGPYDFSLRQDAVSVKVPKDTPEEDA